MEWLEPAAQQPRTARKALQVLPDPGVKLVKQGTLLADMNRDDLFALMSALGWAVDNPDSRRGPIISSTLSRAPS